MLAVVPGDPIAVRCGAAILLINIELIRPLFLFPSSSERAALSTMILPSDIFLRQWPNYEQFAMRRKQATTGGTNLPLANVCRRFNGLALIGCSHSDCDACLIVVTGMHSGYYHLL